MGVDRTELDQLFTINERVSVVPITTGRVLSAGDLHQYIRATGTSNITVSIPSPSELTIPVGSWFTVTQRNSGTVTLVASSGISVNTPTSATLVINKLGGEVTFKCVAAGTFDAGGDLTGMYDISAA
jgi:hypothetical protein